MAWVAGAAVAGVAIFIPCTDWVLVSRAVWRLPSAKSGPEYSCRQLDPNLFWGPRGPELRMLSSRANNILVSAVGEI